MENQRENRIYEFEDFRLDAASLLLYRNGNEVSLTPKAVLTLQALLKRHGEVVGKQDLMEMIWADTVVEESNLAQYLHLLRKTLGKGRDGKPFIETLKRRGYRFNGQVKVSVALEACSPKGLDEETSSAKYAVKDESAANRRGDSPRVERHGNVLTLVDWLDERSDSIQQPAPEIQVAPVETSPSLIRHRPLIAFAGGAATVLVAVLALWTGYVGTERKWSKGELTFLNLTNGETVDYATISRDGNYFVYSSQENGSAHLWLQQTRQSSRREIVPPFKGAVYGTTFSPDSRQVYFVSNEGNGSTNTLYRIPALGGLRTKILEDIATPISISPDGEQIVFARWDHAASTSSLIVASSDGAWEKTILTRSGDEAIANGGAWSPDGKLIAYSSITIREAYGQCTIMAIDPESRETKLLSPERWDTCFRMMWTSDGQGLVFSGTRFREASSTRRDQVFYLSIADGEARRLTTDGNRHQYASLGITDRDEILIVPFNRSSQIWAMSASGDVSTATQITNGHADGRSGIEPLGDGSLSYLTRNGDGFSIWNSRSDGTDAKQLTTEPPNIEELRTANDGRFSVFAATLDGFSHLYRVDERGENLQQLTFGATHEVDSDISPDGEWVVYGSRVFNGSYGKFALWRVPSAGGPPVLVSDTNCRSPYFSPDGEFLSCVSDDEKTIFVVSVRDGSVLNKLPSDPNSILNAGARWTPDGTSLAYISAKNGIGNIWVKPINNGPSFALTNFTSDEIYNFAFGVSDERLYLARGHLGLNVVLITNFR